MDQAGEVKIDLRIVMLRPAGVPEGWERTDLWISAQAISRALVMSDPEGQEAAGFGVSTSGTAILYDASGRLVFHGGITPSRGHEGPSGGGTAIAAFLAHEQMQTTHSEVYGCPLTACRLSAD